MATVAAFALVHAPTLLIVGSLDTPLIAMNQEALARLAWFTRRLRPHSRAA